MGAIARVTSCAPPSERRVTRGDLSDCLRLAMQRTGTNVKTVAAAWGCDHAYVSRVLSGEKALTDEKLALLSDELQDATLEAWAEQRGKLIGSKAAAARSIEGLHALLLLDVPLRMAKADLP